MSAEWIAQAEALPGGTTRLLVETRPHNNFDALRLGMALLVVWSHSFALHLGSERAEWISLLLGGTYNAGNLGVMAFFIISGFLITQSWERSKTVGSYFEKRVRRIYPGYLVAAFVCAFVIVPLYGGDLPNVGTTIVSGLRLKVSLPEVFVNNPGSPVNGSLWSISYEFWCYVGVAVAGSLLLKRRTLLIALYVLLVAAKITQDATDIKPGLGPIGSLFGWPYLWTKIGPSFILGMAAYAYRAVIPRSPGVALALIISTLLGSRAGQSVADLLVAPTLAYLVFYAAFSTRLSLHHAARHGDLSYGAYLYAFPIQQILQATIGKHLSLPVFFVLAAALSLLAGFASWHLVEKHFKSRRHVGMQRSEVARANSPGNVNNLANAPDELATAESELRCVRPQSPAKRG